MWYDMTFQYVYNMYYHQAKQHRFHFRHLYFFVLETSEILSTILNIKLNVAKS